MKELESSFELYQNENNYLLNFASTGQKQNSKNRSVKNSPRKIRQVEDFTVLYQRSDDISNLYEECVGKESIEPIVVLAEQIESSFSIQHLLTKI